MTHRRLVRVVKGRYTGAPLPCIPVTARLLLVKVHLDDLRTTTAYIRIRRTSQVLQGRVVLLRGVQGKARYLQAASRYGRMLPKHAAQEKNPRMQPCLIN